MTEIWVSPEGVSHLVIVRQDHGPVMEPDTELCATCGRRHNVLHFRNTRVYAEQYAHLPEGTRHKVREIPWPYECGAKDKHPDHVVYQCVPHGVWWHEPR